MRYTKSLCTALALTVGALTFSGSAEARHRHHRHHHHGGNAAAAGVFGFAAGAILGGALAQPRYYEPRYVEPRYVEPRYVEPRYYRPAPVVYSYEPWSPEWYSYCESRYRSFNGQTGYFLGYDGEYHFCR